MSLPPGFSFRPQKIHSEGQKFIALNNPLRTKLYNELCSQLDPSFRARVRYELGNEPDQTVITRVCNSMLDELKFKLDNNL